LEAGRDEKGFEKGRCPLYSKNEDSVDMETRNWREHLLSSKWRSVCSLFKNAFSVT
jgi:hypothetical protein